MFLERPAALAAVTREEPAQPLLKWTWVRDSVSLSISSIQSVEVVQLVPTPEYG